MNRTKTLVLDSWAVMAYLLNEGPAEQVANIIANAHDENARMLMSVVNVGEVWYVLERRSSARNADNAVAALRSIGVEFIDVDWAQTQIAARFKAAGGISYADCFAAALAKHRKASLLTGDNEFRQVEKEIPIMWLA
jgi:ribonuclease VapC